MKTNGTHTDGNVAVEDVSSLIQKLASPAGMTRLHAREALIDAGDDAVDALIEALRDKRAIVRWEAAKALVNIPRRRAAPALVDALQDNEFDVRWLAAEALISQGPDALLPLMEALTQHADSVWLREGAHHVLKSLRDRHTADVVKPVLAALDYYDADLSAPAAARDAIALLKKLNHEIK
ncbi:MAG: HEAT repeat domain-containing protein [Phycisphaerales bacterium]|nr:HEAT repeat domain-containing protein [Phycisphaerales bacterium]